MQDDSGIKKILTLAWAYRLFQVLVGSAAARRWVGDHFWRLQPGQKMLDIGCGPGVIVQQLPTGVRYVGFDISEQYIANARRRHAGDPDKQFIVGVAEHFTQGTPATMQGCDLVVVNGLMHHLDDAQAIAVLQLAYSALVPGGRMVCLEPSFLLRQSPLSRWFLRRDRGRNVRNEQQWKALTAQVFDDFDTHILTGLVRIPYTHIVIEARR